MRVQYLALVGLFPATLVAQTYATWHTGNAADMVAQPQGGVCMMGGATEHDQAMRWFLQRASGGDVLVLRASGSDGYNEYMYSELGVAVNSVRTIRFNSAAAAQDPFVLGRIQEAEAIWFAGGDQWDYVSYWRGTPVATLVNQAIAERNIVIGGTSAGMAILGGLYFTAQNGTVTSAAALSSPYAASLVVSMEPFLNVPWLATVVTDTHYDNPDRRARHAVFMARTIADHGINARGIACNEYVAVCVDENGLARVFGEWPDYEEYAYFLQANCLTPGSPEVCATGMPLTWDYDGRAVKAYKVPGTMEGSNTFDLSDWHSGSGGTWEDWRITQGVFATTTGELAVDCAAHLLTEAGVQGRLHHFGGGRYAIEGLNDLQRVRLCDAAGRGISLAYAPHPTGGTFQLPAEVAGLFIVQAQAATGTIAWKLAVE